MKRAVSPQGGYTIVETMIFLGVSGALFVMAMLLINGQQQRTEFNQAVRDVNSQIQDTINDVATGYYNSPGSFSCVYDATGPKPSTLSPKPQGTNSDCIFVGRVMGFGVTGKATQLNIFNIIGNRLNASAVQVSDLAESLPVALSPETDPPAVNTPDTTQTSSLPGGVQIGCITTTDDCTNNGSLGAVGFFTTFGSSAGQLDSSAQATDLIAIPASSWSSQNNAAAIALNIRNQRSNLLPAKNPTKGVKICLISGGSNQHAYITIGGAGKLTTKIEILSTRSCNE